MAESKRGIYFSVSAIVLYTLFFLQTVATVFYYLGWMNNYVFTISPLVLMILTIVQASIYLIAWVFFFLRMIPNDVFSFIKQKAAREAWVNIQLAQCTAHAWVTFVLSVAGLVMASVWYGKYNGSLGTPVYADGDSYIWFKNIFLWMTVVWAIELSRVMMLISSWHILIEGGRTQMAAATLLSKQRIN
jgi:hypothetical protein